MKEVNRWHEGYILPLIPCLLSLLPTCHEVSQQSLVPRVPAAMIFCLTTGRQQRGPANHRAKPLKI
jgi:hypothetical protein